MASRLRGLVSVALFGFLGCVNDGNALAQECRQRTPSVAGGVYGCVTAYDDVGDNQVVARADFTVQVFSSGVMPAPDDGRTLVASGRSDGMGFYELSLAPGSYWLCTSFYRCTELCVPLTGRTRADYEFGAGPGWGRLTCSAP